MPETDCETTQTVENRAQRYAQAAAMLRRWLQEAEHENESQYDWEAIDSELEDGSMRCQEPDIDERETP